MAKLESSSPRKQKTQTERRELLIQAALRVMLRDGVSAASTRAITQEADMPHGAFQYCFAGKRDLYRALLQAEVNRDINSIMSATVVHDSPAQIFETALIARWEFIESNAEEQLVLFELGELALRDPELREVAQWELEASTEQARLAVERLSENHTWQLKLPSLDIARLIVTAVDGIARAWLRHQDNAQARKTLTDLASILATLVTEERK